VVRCLLDPDPDPDLDPAWIEVRVGPALVEAELDVVDGRGVAVLAEGGLQVGVPVEVPVLVESVGGTTLSLAESEVMLRV
jgi:hypothetical protein